MTRPFALLAAIGAAISLSAAAADLSCPDLATLVQVNACPNKEELQYTYTGYCSDNARMYDTKDDVCTNFQTYRKLKNVVLWESGDGAFSGYLSCDLPAARVRSAVARTIAVARQGSMDLITLPHTLELSRQPHATLRDAARALVPGGTLLISGFHTPSLWFNPLARKRAAHLQLPAPKQLIAHQRLLDWLGLVGLSVESIHYGAYRPLGCQGGDFSRWAVMERWGQACWPFFGAAYFLQARKQVLGARYLHPQWQNAQLSTNTVPGALNRPQQNPRHQQQFRVAEIAAQLRAVGRFAHQIELVMEILGKLGNHFAGL